MPGRRDPTTTKQRLLQAVFRVSHREGFRSADLKAILARAGVTKGALYHHFGGKAELGHEMVDQVLRDWILGRWLYPIEKASDPIGALIELARRSDQEVTPERLALGCPLNNLSQEMSAIDEGFRQRLSSIYQEWRDGLRVLLERGQRNGTVREGVDAASAATFIVASWEGSIGLAQCERSKDVLSACRLGIERYLETLRPTHPTTS
ncbi:MAG: TetR/AcrR family transcriptional regulator [Thermoanaerobaculia bacterium]